MLNNIVFVMFMRLIPKKCLYWAYMFIISSMMAKFNVDQDEITFYDVCRYLDV